MQHTLLDYYKAIEDGSQKMLTAAKSKDWDQVVRYEGVCAVLIEQLRQRAHEVPLLPEQRSEKAKIMQRILHNDAEVRFLTEPYLDEIESQFSATSPQTLH